MNKRIFFYVSFSIVFLFIFDFLYAEYFSLQDCIDYANENNQSIKSSQAQFNASKAELWKASSNFLPTLNLASIYTRYDEEITYSFSIPEIPGESKINSLYQFPDEIIIQPLEFRVNSLTISYPLFLGGIRYQSYKIAKLNKEISNYSLKSVRNEVILKVIESYLGLVKANGFVRIAESALESLNEHSKQVKQMYELGMVGKSDVLRMEVEVARAEKTLIQAKNMRETMKSALNLSIGRNPQLPLEVSQDLTLTILEIPGIESCIKIALSNHPDYKKIQNSIEIAKQGRNISVSNLIPSLISEYSMSKTDKALGFTDKLTTWKVNLIASWDFPLGLSKIADIIKANEELSSLTYQAKAIEDAIRFQVESNYFLIEEKRAELELSNREYESAKENKRIVEKLYNSGMATQLEYLDAQIALTQAQLSEISSRLDYYLNIAKLAVSIGYDPYYFFKF